MHRKESEITDFPVYCSMSQIISFLLNLLLLNKIDFLFMRLTLIFIYFSFKKCVNFYHYIRITLQWFGLEARHPVPSTDQALPSCFYFRISWILMEQHRFYFFCPLGFLGGLRSLKHWLLQKLSMKNLEQKFKFLIKK